MLKGKSVEQAGKGMGYELFEMKAYIRDNWKILRLPVPLASGDWQLYDLSKDPGETTDLSAEFPEIRQELITLWENYARTNALHDHRGHYDSVYLKAYGVK
jgi:arylsulfatase